MKMVLSESPYPSNSNLLNNYVVLKYYVAPRCSLACLSCESLPCKFWKNNEIVNSFLLYKGLYEIRFSKNKFPYIFQL
jgi:hypothetical protein